MEQQGTLFDAPLDRTSAKVLAARLDPDTSHIAAADVVKSGLVEANKAKLAAGLRKHRGFTSRELAKMLHMDRHEVARRLPDLANEQPPRARRGPVRNCSLGNRPAVTWFPV